MIKSLRIDAALSDRIRRAARAKGMTESEFMREAIEGRALQTLEGDEGSLYERTRHLILPPIEGEVQVTALDVEEMVEEKHARITERYRRRKQASRDPAAG